MSKISKKINKYQAKWCKIIGKVVKNILSVAIRENGSLTSKCTKLLSLCHFENEREAAQNRMKH